MAIIRFHSAAGKEVLQIDHRASIQEVRSFRLALMLALATGVVTIASVYLIGKTGGQQLYEFANELGGIGNDIFLVLTNALIIIWAWRKRMPEIIRLTLAMDAMVWIIVQPIKLIPFGEWALRPNGEIGGFPSGHTTHAFAMAFLLTVYFPRYAWLWFFCAGLISWSRVESAWHTPLQVTAGVFFGIAIGAAFVIYWFKRYGSAGKPES